MQTQVKILMSGYMANLSVIRQKAGVIIPGINKHPLNAISHFIIPTSSFGYKEAHVIMDYLMWML